MTARVADLTLAEVGQRLLRYRPVALAIAAALVGLRLLPLDGDPPQATEAAAPITTSVPLQAPASPAPADRDGGAASTGATVAPSPLRIPSRSPSPPASAPAPTTPAPTPVAEVATPAPAPTTTLPAPSIRYTAWAQAERPTSLLAEEPADDVLPVAARLGEVDRVSFLRLEGPWDELVLRFAPGSSEPPTDGLAACPIVTATWDPARGEAIADAPRWDPASCVLGSPGVGAWHFAVGAIDRTHGVAIVPDPEAGIDFGVAFLDPTRTEPTS